MSCHENLGNMTMNLEMMKEISLKNGTLIERSLQKFKTKEEKRQQHKNETNR